MVLYFLLLYSWRFSRYSAPTHWLFHGHMTSNNETVSRQMPWAGNIVKTMTSNGKQLTVTREMLTAVAGISARYSKLAFVLWSIYEIIHICTAVIDEVKIDYRNKFSNLSNWKEEAWKNQGFNRIRTRDLRDTNAMLYQLSYEATHWKRGKYIEFIFSRTTAVHIWMISYILHITSLYGKIWTQ